MQNYLAPFILVNENHTIRNTVIISSYFGLQLIFTPFNFVVLFGSRNSMSRMMISMSRIQIREIKGSLTLTVLQYTLVYGHVYSISLLTIYFHLLL